MDISLSGRPCGGEASEVTGQLTVGIDYRWSGIHDLDLDVAASISHRRHRRGLTQRDLLDDVRFVESCTSGCSSCILNEEDLVGRATERVRTRTSVKAIA
jgi:hypothetical protein